MSILNGLCINQTQNSRCSSFHVTPQCCQVWVTKPAQWPIQTSPVPRVGTKRQSQRALQHLCAVLAYVYVLSWSQFGRTLKYCCRPGNPAASSERHVTLALDTELKLTCFNVRLSMTKQEWFRA